MNTGEITENKTKLCFYFRDFASVNFNSSSNFVIEHFRRTDFPTLIVNFHSFARHTA